MSSYQCPLLLCLAGSSLAFLRGGCAVIREFKRELERLWIFISSTHLEGTCCVGPGSSVGSEVAGKLRWDLRATPAVWWNPRYRELAAEAMRESSMGVNRAGSTYDILLGEEVTVCPISFNGKWEGKWWRGDCAKSPPGLPSVESCH